MFKLSNRFIYIFIFFFSILVLPNYFKEILLLSSTTQIFILIQFIFLLIFGINVFLNKKFLITLFLIYLFYFILLLFRIRGGYNVDWIKYNTFYIFIIIMYINVYNINKKLTLLSNQNFELIIKYIVYLFSLGAFFALTGFTIFGRITERKPVFFYSEPSHFALAIAPFLFTYLWCVKSKFSKFILIFFILFSLLYKSLTLLMVILFYFIFFKKIFSLKSIVIFIVTFSIFLSSTYFISRIPNSGEESKESYSYLQGVEQIYNTFNDGYFFGIGPQQMGVNLPKGEITEIMYIATNGFYLNQYDGSIGVAKLLVEFGFLGVVLCFYIIYLVYKSRNLLFLNYWNVKQVFLYSSAISGLIYLFIRGGGYFCSTYFFLFLFLFNFKSIFYLNEL